MTLVPDDMQVALGIKYLPKFLSIQCNQGIPGFSLSLPHTKSSKKATATKHKLDTVIIPMLQDWYATNGKVFEQEHAKYVHLLDSFHTLAAKFN